MKRKIFGILMLLRCVTRCVNASISVGVSGPGTLLNTYEGPVVFPQIGFSGEGTITTWSINGFDSVIKTVDYAQGDLDFTGAFNSGFRWAETLTNNRWCRMGRFYDQSDRYSEHRVGRW